MIFANWHFSIWRHPYHYAASLIAKLATNVATLIWAVVVLSSDNALLPDRFSFYATMTNIMSEDYWATVALAFAGFGAFRLLSKAPPVWWGAIGYGLQMIFWTYLAIAYAASGISLRPATTAWLTVGALLSVYAFASNPRARNDEHSTDHKR